MVRGRIVKRKRANDVVYRVRLDYGIDPETGKRNEPADTLTFTAKGDAERRLQKLLYEANRGPKLDPSRRTVGALVAEWLEQGAAGTVRNKTFDDYSRTCRLHIVPAFGHILATSLTLAQIEGWRSKRLAAGLGKRTIAKTILGIGQAYKYGIRHGYVSHNPLVGLKPLRKDYKEMQVWTAAQAEQFLDVAAKHIYHPIWHLALQTGLRRGELGGLKWEDVDWRRGILRVRRSIGWVAGKMEEDDTKTGHSRSIDLDKTTLGILRRHFDAREERRLQAGPYWQEWDWICCSTVGTAIHGRNLGKALRALQEEAGVPRIRFHDMRHTCASLLLARGTPPHIVSKMLGHRSVMMTMDIYAHVMEGQGREAAEAMEKFLGQQEEEDGE